MSALYIFACVALIVALGYIGVSWAVAGAGLCGLGCLSLRLSGRSHEGDQRVTNCLSIGPATAGG